MYMYERLEREGRTDIRNMPLVHSAMSEDIAFRRVLRLARYVEGAAVYFVHVSARAGRRRHRRGARPRACAVYGETLHHYASFTADAYLRPDGVHLPHVPVAQARGGSPAALERARGRHAQHGRHRRAVHAARDQGAEPPRRRRHGRPRRRRDAGAHHLHRGRVEARDVARALRRGDVDQCGEDPRALSEKGRHRRRAATPTSSSSIRPCAGRCASEDLHGSDYSAWDGWEVHGWPRT